MYCDDVLSNLKRFLGVNLKDVRLASRVEGEECTIDYVRKDACSSLKDKSFCGLYDRGAVWITENPDMLRAGDVVVPLSKARAKRSEIVSSGCIVTEWHPYDGSDPKRPNLGVAHIHLECPEGYPAKRLAELIAL